MRQEFRRQLARLGATSMALAAVILLMPANAGADERDDEPVPADDCSTTVVEDEQAPGELGSVQSSRALSLGLTSVAPADLPGAVNDLASSLDLDVADARELLTDLLGDACGDTDDGDRSDLPGLPGEDSDTGRAGDAEPCGTVSTQQRGTGLRDTDGPGPKATDDATPTTAPSVSDEPGYPDEDEDEDGDGDGEGPATTTSEPKDADCVSGAGTSSGSGPSERGTAAGYIVQPSHRDAGNGLAQPSIGGHSSPDATTGTSPDRDGQQAVAQRVNSPHPLADTTGRERLPLSLAVIALLAVGAALARTWQRRRTV